MALLGVQQAAYTWALSKTNESAFITGSAGTGKSHLLKMILEGVKSRRIPGVFVTASTGIAAVNVDGVTIYNFLGVRQGFELLTPEEVVKFAKSFTKPELKDYEPQEKWKYWKRITIAKVRILWIDEISMVHARFFQNMDTFLRILCGRPRQPFGGIRLFMMGDFLQLPPVPLAGFDGEDDPLFVFETENWRALNPTVFCLVHSFRQENDVRFFNMLNEIRWGIVSDATRALLESCVRTLPDDYTGPRMTLMPINSDVTRINRMHIDSINKPLKTYKADDKGPAHLLRDLRVESTITLKEGAQVMLLKNISIKRPRSTQLMDVDDAGDDDAAGQAPAPVDILPNGAMGRVVGFIGESETDNGMPLVAFPTIGNVGAHTRVMNVEKFDIVESMDKPPVATRYQLPLVPSYAMSIHKSQGQTIVNPIVTSTKKIFAPGQFYVLLSRARSLDQIYMDDLDVTKITAHPKAVAFMRPIDKNCPLTS